MPHLVLLLLVAAIFALALLPTRRLFLSGWAGRSLGAYFALLLAIGLLVALTRGRVGFLLPILVLLYLAPFVTARHGVRVIRDRLDRGIRNVTPPDEYVRSQPRDPGSGMAGGV